MIATKLALDQGVLAPTCLNFFVGWTGALSGHDNPRIKRDMRNNVPKMWLTSCMTWIPIQALNFAVMPARLQPLVVNSVNVGYIAALSLINNSRKSGLERNGETAVATVTATDNRADDDAVRPSTLQTTLERQTLSLTV